MLPTKAKENVSWVLSAIIGFTLTAALIYWGYNGIAPVFRAPVPALTYWQALCVVMLLRGLRTSVIRWKFK